MSSTALRWLFGIVAVVLGIKHVSESEMRRLDQEVDRLCAIDGGVHIYETVKLPASKFSETGRPLLPYGGQDDTGFGYFQRGETKTLAGPSQEPGARLLRHHTQVVRTLDGKVFAEAVIYTRGGGEFLEGVPGVGHGKNCPTPPPLDIDMRVFFRE